MKKILIIEDESSMRNSLEEFFSEEGFEVTTAMDGASGYEMIRSKKFDVILLDIILPRMDGFEILNKIKEEGLEHAPIVLLTNLGEAENIQKALDLGATTYLIKSDYQLREIIDKVNAVIETKAKN
jgi:two-component system chemotaxis sensor kinase CheA